MEKGLYFEQTVLRQLKINQQTDKGQPPLSKLQMYTSPEYKRQNLTQPLLCPITDAQH